MQKLNDKCEEWKKAENISYSVYGTPMESTTYKFAKCLQKRFGIIKGVTDKNYITNSYHVHVSEKIDAFKKLKFEADPEAFTGWSNQLHRSTEYAEQYSGSTFCYAVYLQ